MNPHVRYYAGANYVTLSVNGVPTAEAKRILQMIASALHVHGNLLKNESQANKERGDALKAIARSLETALANPVPLKEHER